MEAVKYRVSAFLLLFPIWLLIMYPFALPDVYLGAGVAFFLVLIPFPGMGKVYKEISLAPKRILFALVYLLVFLKLVVQSNLDVAFRVLHPRMPINPGIVKVKTKLKSSLGRLFLANSITLTPGTITVDIQGENLYIHWIDITTENPQEATEKIVAQFEKYLEVIFG